MSNQYFKMEDTVFNITEKYPETINLLAANGFENLKNDLLRKTLGKTISLEQALRSKKINLEVFEQKMVEFIEQANPTVTTGLTRMQKLDGSDIRIEGVLPCPIRLPLLERFEDWLKEHQKEFGYEVDYDLKAASMGLDDIKAGLHEQAGDENAIADLFLSAGFDLFFDKELMGSLKERGVFKDLSGLTKLNADFDNDKLDLKDPRGEYSVIGVVAAIFMVNTAVLGDRPFPTKWSDLLKPEYENTISLPMRDLDLFNALLLNIYKEFGEEGIRKLGRNLLRSMHPAQMVKSNVKRAGQEVPAITVMPYFFTQMVDEKGPMKPVWPEEGAIVSPIFLLAKEKAKDKVKPFVDFFFSPAIGEIMSAGGKFPSTNPAVDNHLTPEQNFLWLGWDYINTHDIGALLKETEAMFFAASGEE
ncbi:MAG TPA: ABC transporter substrate-binding protein [Candidatus Avacidaminococcus intestinavium]|uniref:ABC transporter substrate-binding protein n=1 Tax=Candidatus Avacidaminococcus intestinavium TaxID=2840684 RepID=A0A9D1SKN4_9FIRM|nr:ABC transporter substrate-binding protein [Candidatus Avacidaminococcus intestinavium]